MALICNIDENYWAKNLVICGIDEVGRGAIAGPVVASAVILKPYSLLNIGVDDSKNLTAEKRKKLADTIKNSALSIGIGIVDNATIDKVNILQATFLAMKEAINKLDCKADIYLIDGNRNFSKEKKYKTVVDGDSQSLSIASASIVAKVYRDTWMQEVAHKLFPEYEFYRNKGYGTAFHIAKIKEIGISTLHRTSFLQKILNFPTLF